MDNKSNIKQALFEVFGIGSDISEKSAQPVSKSKDAHTAPPPKKAAEPVASVPAPRPATSFFAPGTVLEGTLRSAGDIEIAGTFRGDISTEGIVILHSDIRSNVTASSLDLNGCRLEGDITVKEHVFIDSDSSVGGNVTARELKCAGQITGDLNVTEGLLLDENARINGSLTAGFISVVKGAVINGSIEIKPSGI